MKRKLHPTILILTLRLRTARSSFQARALQLLEMPGVFYIVQGECGEDVSHPNCFNVPTKGKVTLDLVKRHFPLRAEGTFHFRFRAAGKGGAFSWVDVGPGAELPRGQLFMKVLRTGAFLSHRNARRCRLITAVHHAILTPCHTHSHPLPHTHTHTHEQTR